MMLNTLSWQFVTILHFAKLMYFYDLICVLYDLLLAHWDLGLGVDLRACFFTNRMFSNK